jgi:hypothetical protein
MIYANKLRNRLGATKAQQLMLMKVKLRKAFNEDDERDDEEFTDILPLILIDL